MARCGTGFFVLHRRGRFLYAPQTKKNRRSLTTVFNIPNPTALQDDALKLARLWAGLLD